MVALTSDRNTPYRLGDTRVQPVAAGVVIFAGSLVMRNASGFITKGATATGAVAVGRAEAKVDNSGGAAGAANVEYRQGIFAFENAGADPVTQAGVGKLCFVLDDQTVAATDGAGTRSRAGIVDGLEGGRVWVRLDEAITRGA